MPPKFAGSGARNQVSVVGRSGFIHVKSWRIAGDAVRIKHEKQNETCRDECPSQILFGKKRLDFHCGNWCAQYTAKFGRSSILTCRQIWNTPFARHVAAISATLSSAYRSPTRSHAARNA